MENNITILCKAIKEVVPQVMEDWNQNKLNEFSNLFESDFESFFAGKQTQEKTKIVSPILNKIFIRLMNNHNTIESFIDNDESGSDYLFNEDISLEGKITLSSGNSWTGNGYYKVPLQVLIRYTFSDEGEITSFFSMVADLSETKGQWDSPSTQSNFSSLKFYNEDKEHLMLCNGKILQLKKYLKYEHVCK